MEKKQEIIKVGLAAIKGGRLLVVREAGTALFILPGGRPEHGEDDLGALRREIYEELGSEIVDNAPEFLGTFSDTAANDENKVVTVRLYRGEPQEPMQALGEIEEIKWFSPESDELEALAPSIKNKILPFLMSKGLIYGRSSLSKS